MAIVRNIQVKLDVPVDHRVLDETVEQFRAAAQFVADYGWADDARDIGQAHPVRGGSLTT